MNTQHLILSVFNEFERNRVRYAVLRGFENLPLSYSNDIDLGIHPSDISRYFDSLANLKKN